MVDAFIYDSLLLKTEGRHEPNEACPINSPLPKPAGDAAAGATHHLVGHEGRSD
jgi:hypothetical protein